MDSSNGLVLPVLVGVAAILGLLLVGVFTWNRIINKQRKSAKTKRGFSMTPMMIHLPPATEDIQIGGRDERDVVNEAISQAQIMYSILSSTIQSGWNTKVLGQNHMSFEIIAANGLIKFFTMVPVEIKEVVKQAIVSAYPAARVEEVREDNIFSKFGGLRGVAGVELNLKREYIYPIATYEETKWDGESVILNALAGLKKDEGAAVQILFRPAREDWTKASNSKVYEIREGKKTGYGISDILRAPFEVPEDKKDVSKESLSNLQQDEITAIEGKTKFPAFEVLIRLIASTSSKERSDAVIGGLTSAFSQYNSPANNGFNVEMKLDPGKLSLDYMYRSFPVEKRTNILNSVEMASIFHLPNQNVIPSSRVERQLTKQVDGPAKLAMEGLLLGVNEFRGQEKEIRLTEDDRRRHTYIIGQTGMGKSVLLGNLAYQDMLAGRGFAFIDPHGDVVEDLLSKVPKERMDDVIYFDPGDLEHPMGMNMFEFETPDQKDFIVQEGINMLYSLYDPGHTGIFGPRGEHMFRNAALLLMSDPNGATFIDIPKVFIDPEFVKEKLKYVTDKNVYDYWTKEYPESRKSNDAGEVTTWFVSKWGPFLSNTMMRNILGQTKSGFNIRDLMDNNKILLVNLSKGKMGELNSKLLGMIFVMKFQTAAMSRVNIPENQRKDFCLFVDEFQNFSTDSFESILSEARKFRLNLVIANQFMTQLTDKIKDGILGNVGTIICGRIGITDAEVMEKAFMPTFNAEDLHKQPNYHAITTVMMFGVPSSPFTMKLLPPMGESSEELRESLKLYSATRYGNTRTEVEREIEMRTAPVSSSEPRNEAFEEKMKYGPDGLPIPPSVAK